MALQIDVERREDRAVLRLDGRLDLIGAPGLRDAVETAVAGGDARIVVDLEGVSFVDSSGVGALVGGLRRAREAGGDLVLAAPGEQARTVIALTGVDRVLVAFADVDAALASP